MALIHWGVKTSSTILDWTKSPFRPRLNPLEAAQRTVSWLLMVTYSNMIIFLYFYQSSSVWGVQTRTQEHTVATVSGSLNSFYSCDPPYCSRWEQLSTVHTDCRRVQICNFNVQCVFCSVATITWLQKNNQLIVYFSEQTCQSFCFTSYHYKLNIFEFGVSVAQRWINWQRE